MGKPPKHNFGIDAIEALVKQGKTVVSGEGSFIVAAVLRAIEQERIATFYVTLRQYAEIMKRHWTPERVKASGMKLISEEEVARIRSEFSLEISGYSNVIVCPRCGHNYGMYEFIQQGIEEHGREAVEGIFALKDIAVVRVNPVQPPVCPNCRLAVVIAGDPWNHYYICRQYGCCSYS